MYTVYNCYFSSCGIQYATSVTKALFAISMAWLGIGGLAMFAYCTMRTSYRSTAVLIRIDSRMAFRTDQAMREPIFIWRISFIGIVYVVLQVWFSVFLTTIFAYCTMRTSCCSFLYMCWFFCGYCLVIGIYLWCIGRTGEIATIYLSTTQYGMTFIDGTIIDVLSPNMLFLFTLK